MNLLHLKGFEGGKKKKYVFYFAGHTAVLNF